MHNKLQNRSGRSHRSLAFTFVEVLFAIMILGIGFIMIAGMLPVAIRQSEETQSDVTARAITDSAYAQLTSMVTSVTSATAELPDSTLYVPDRALYTGAPFLFTPAQNTPAVNLFSTIRGNTQSSSDGRFAYTTLLRRTSATAAYEAIVIAIQTRNASQYPAGLFGNGNTDNGPHIATFTIFEGDTVGGGLITGVGPDRITFTGVTLSGGTPLPGAEIPTLIRDGTFVVTTTGRIFRVGRFESGTTYELRSGINSDLPLIGNSNFSEDTSFNAATSGYVVGAGVRDPTIAWTATGNPFTGPAQDIGIAKMTLR